MLVYSFKILVWKGLEICQRKVQYQQVYQETTRGELGNVLDYHLKALTLYFKKYCIKGIFELYFGCFICMIDVVL